MCSVALNVTLLNRSTRDRRKTFSVGQHVPHPFNDIIFNSDFFFFLKIWVAFETDVLRQELANNGTNIGTFYSAFLFPLVPTLTHVFSSTPLRFDCIAVWRGGILNGPVPSTAVTTCVGLYLLRWIFWLLPEVFSVSLKYLEQIAICKTSDHLLAPYYTMIVVRNRYWSEERFSLPSSLLLTTLILWNVPSWLMLHTYSALTVMNRYTIRKILLRSISTSFSNTDTVQIFRTRIYFYTFNQKYHRLTVAIYTYFNKSLLVVLKVYIATQIAASICRDTEA